MHDSNRVISEKKDWLSQEGEVVGHPTMVVSEIVPDDVRGDSEHE